MDFKISRMVVTALRSLGTCKLVCRMSTGHYTQLVENRNRKLGGRHCDLDDARWSQIVNVSRARHLNHRDPGIVDRYCRRGDGTQRSIPRFGPQSTLRHANPWPQVGSWCGCVMAPKCDSGRTARLRHWQKRESSCRAEPRSTRIPTSGPRIDTPIRTLASGAT
jgi:hypothetical protein